MFEFAHIIQHLNQLRNSRLKRNICVFFDGYSCLLRSILISMYLIKFLATVIITSQAAIQVLLPCSNRARALILDRFHHCAMVQAWWTPAAFASLLSFSWGCLLKLLCFKGWTVYSSRPPLGMVGEHPKAHVASKTVTSSCCLVSLVCKMSNVCCAGIRCPWGTVGSRSPRTPTKKRSSNESERSEATKCSNCRRSCRRLWP